MSATESITLTTTDGCELVGELAAPESVDVAVVACHPHPLYGGSMHANVVEVLFRELPAAGAAVLRFNFRGANGSGGQHDEGRAERLDVIAAIDEAVARWPGVPVLLAGYSFGADVALAVDHERLAAWMAVAPPLRIVDPSEMVALSDERPTFFVGASHDQYRPYAELTAATSEVPNATLVEAKGADHFFAVGLDVVAATARDAVEAIS